MQSSLLLQGPLIKIETQVLSPYIMKLLGIHRGMSTKIVASGEYLECVITGPRVNDGCLTVYEPARVDILQSPSSSGQTTRTMVRRRCQRHPGAAPTTLTGSASSVEIGFEILPPRMRLDTSGERLYDRHGSTFS